MPKLSKPAHNFKKTADKIDPQLEAVQTQLASVIELVLLAELKPSPKNPLTHSKRQIKQLVRSIQEFGYTAPSLIDEHNQILAGHGRLEAAKVLGLKVIPCVRLAHMSEAQKRAYIIADNKLALNAGWDNDILAEEVEALLGLESGFDLTLTGFSVPEIDTVIANHRPEKPGNPDDDRLPIPDQVRTRCRPGDIFQLGPHRLICGDARDRKTIAALMGGNLARMIFTDPPFNVPIQGNVGGLGRIKHGEFAMGSGEMSNPQFIAFLKASFSNLAAFSHDGSIHYIFMANF